MGEPTDPLEQLLAAERSEDAPRPGTADRGWARLSSGIPGGGGPGEPGTDATDGPGDAAQSEPYDSPDNSGADPTAVTRAATSLSVKVACTLALATAAAVAVAVQPWRPTPPPPPPETATFTLPPTAQPSPSTPQPLAGMPSPPDSARTARPPAPATAPATPTAPAPRPPVRRKAALPEVPGEGLAHELALLRRAQQQLSANRPRRALRWLRKHIEDHPNGLLTEEREAARTVARCMLTPSSATLATFTSRWPQSTHLVRVQDACSDDPLVP